MSNRPSLDDYIDVAERINAFNGPDGRYPDGSLETIRWQLVTVGDKLFVVYHAAAYRTADDPRPGEGMAWEPFPGPTPYTKDSELMNAETAAWGRAIVAVGITANRKIASKQEVRARSGDKQERNAPAKSNDAAPKINEKRAKALYAGAALLDLEEKLQLAACHVAGMDVGDCATEDGAARALRVLTVEQADRLDAWLGQKQAEYAAEAKASAKAGAEVAEQAVGNV